MKEGTIKQILLLTDGCSNEGTDPVASAALAKEYGMTVNVIGILDDGRLGDRGTQEVQDIATAGNGIHQIVYSQQLPRTVQMVTRKAMNQTIQQVVNKELQHILGAAQEIDTLPPAKRGEVIEVVEDLSERLSLELLILVDTSASMKSKLPAVQQALRDLAISMQSREGSYQYTIWTYPGLKTDAEMKLDWSTQARHIEKCFSKIVLGGTTPTGPALERALQSFMARTSAAEQIVPVEERSM